MNCEQVVRQYLEQIRANFVCETQGSRLKIITPYVYPDNDLVEVYVEELPEGRVRVSDLGETTRHLHTQGFDVFASTKRKFLADTAASRMGVTFEGAAISKEGSAEEIGSILFDVIIAARAVADLIYTSRTYEPAPFVEEVADFLTANHFNFERKVPVRGTSGRQYRITFRVESRFLLEPLTAEFERALKPRVDAIVRKWVDINQNQGIRKLTVLNDSDYAWPEPDKIILKRFSQVFLWSDKEQLASAMRTQG
jgi:hypothetical protein